LINTYWLLTKDNGFFDSKRKGQNKFWMLQTIEERLKSDFYDNPRVKQELDRQLSLLDQGKTTPFAAAEMVLGIK